MPTPKLRDRLHAKRVEIAKLEADVARCDETATKGNVHRQAVADLKRERETIVAQAFIDGAPADTKKIDKQISDAEQAHRLAIETGAAATNAKAILEKKISAATVELANIEIENRSQASNECGEAFAHAVAEYENALAAYISAISGIYAVAATTSNFNPAGGTYQMNAYDALIRMIIDHGIVSGPPTYRPLPILDRGPDWTLTQPHVLLIVKRLDEVGLELPPRLAELLEQEIA